MKTERMKWTLGPKFNDYLNLNMKLVRREYVLILGYSVLWGFNSATGHGVLMWDYMADFLIITLLFLLFAVPKLCQESLYHKGAVLFQSVPVSSFETVLAKSIAGALGFQIPVLVLSFMLLGAVTNSEDKWYALYNSLMDLGFQRDNLIAGMILTMWTAAVLAFVVSGSSLLAFTIGNRFSGRSSRWLKWIISVAVMLLLFALAGGALWLVWLMTFMPVLVRLLLIMAATIVLSVVLVRLNVTVLEKWYAI